ncbi:MAG: UPF0280 family protein [Candidatus Hadarchaeales archaeon]
MHEKTWMFKETRLRIKCDMKEAIDVAIDAAFRARWEIEKTIARYPEFRWSLMPIEIPGNHHRVVELMLKAGKIADVGPFAAVAGAISQVAMEAALEAGATDIIVENGGDIALAGSREFRVGIFAGESTSSLGFLVRPEELPLGICTSSGTVGHSISFGDSDAVVVVAREASIADAAATSIGNAVRGENLSQSIHLGLERAKKIPEIFGCLVIRKNQIGVWGKLPELITSSESKEISHTISMYQKYAPPAFLFSAPKSLYL